MILPVIERIARLVSELHPFLAGLAQHFIRPNLFGARVLFEVSLALGLSLRPTRCLGGRLNGRCHVVIAFTTIRSSLPFAASLRGHPSRGIHQIELRKLRVKGILLCCQRIFAAFAAVNEPWTHHISPNCVQRHPLVTSSAESAMGFHFATVGLALEELEPLLLGLAMTL
jgi:hypothetical protein